MQEDQKAVAGSSYEDPLNISLLREYWISKNVTPKCELCNSNNWAITASIDGRRPILVAKKEDDPFADAYNLQTVLTICNNCGNVRTFARHAIEIWKTERDDKVPSNG